MPVRDVHQIVGDRDAQLHVLDLVTPLILARPPDAGALALAGGVDPVPACRVPSEGDSAEAAGLERLAGIGELDRVLAAFLQRLGEVDEDEIGRASCRES